MKRSYVLIIVVAILVYFSFGFAAQIFYNYWGDGMMKIMDVPTYVWAAFDFFSHFKANVMRPLGYPIIIGLPFLFKANLEYTLCWGILINALAWIMTSVLIYKTLRLFTSESYAIGFSLLFTICVGNLEFAYILLSENIYTAVLTWIIFLTASFLVKNKPNHLAWAFALLCLSILIRPTFLPILPIVFVACCWVGYRSIKIVPKSVVIKYAVVVMIGIGLILSQMAMMKKDYGSFAISYNGEKTMFSYLDAYANSMLTKNNLLKERETRACLQYYFLSNNQFHGYDSLCNADVKFQLEHNTRNFFKAWRVNIECNMLMPGSFAIENKKNWPFFESIKRACLFLSGWQNEIFSMFILLSIFIAVFLRKIMTKPSIVIVAINWLLSFFSILISGISFWQYNRFSVIYTPMVIISFALILWSIMNRKKIKLDNGI